MRNPNLMISSFFSVCLVFSGMVVKVQDKYRHPDCFVCTDCEENLKQKGYYFIDDELYCETHAHARAKPPESPDLWPLTVFLINWGPWISHFSVHERLVFDTQVENHNSHQPDIEIHKCVVSALGDFGCRVLGGMQCFALCRNKVVFTKQGCVD